MKLMIGVPTGEYGRRANFYDYFDALEKPEGTVIMRTHGQSPSQGRNVIAEQAIIHDCTHILYIDDDMEFEKDSLNRLLAHADKDVVSGLYLLRNFPHYPAVFDEAFPDGKCKFMFLTPGLAGLHEVVNLGTGFVLIKVEVFTRLEKPWFRLGEIVRDEWCDDVGFFNRVRAAGIKMYCDFDLCVSHQLTIAMKPELVDGVWHTTYYTNTGDKIQFPQVTSLPSGALCAGPERTGE